MGGIVIGIVVGVAAIAAWLHVRARGGAGRIATAADGYIEGGTPGSTPSNRAIFEGGQRAIDAHGAAPGDGPASFPEQPPPKVRAGGSSPIVSPGVVNATMSGPVAGDARSRPMGWRPPGGIPRL